MSCASRRHLLTAVLLTSLPVISLSLPGTTSVRRLLSQKTVSIYSSPTYDASESLWNSLSHQNILHQLEKLKWGVARVPAQPNSILTPETTAVVVPAGSAEQLLFSLGYLGVLAEHVESGGLVVVDDFDGRNTSTQDLIAHLLDYHGAWESCRPLEKSIVSVPQLSSYATEFLDGGWPPVVEDALDIKVQTWCKHEDPAAISYPLYTFDGDPMKTVAQAFSRVGSRGAVVWLGYSWRNGLQDGWGALLHHLVASFDAGMYRPPLDASFMDRYPLRLETVLESAAGLAEETAEAVRRFLSVSAPVYGDSNPSPPPRTFPSLPSTPPGTTRPGRRFARFVRMPAAGVLDANRSVTWYDDVDFQQKLNESGSFSKLWLVDRNHTPCNLTSPCRRCNRAWYPYKDSDLPGFPRGTVVLLFREPVLLKRLTIVELQPPAVLEVFVLRWPFVRTTKLGVNKTQTYADVDPAFDLLTNCTRRVAKNGCSAEMSVLMPEGQDADKIEVPRGRFNATNLPRSLQPYAVGGVGIRIREVSKTALMPQIAEVRFRGRALYPRNPQVYDAYDNSRVDDCECELNKSQLN